MLVSVAPPQNGSRDIRADRPDLTGGLQSLGRQVAADLAPVRSSAARGPRCKGGTIQNQAALDRRLRCSDPASRPRFTIIAPVASQPSANAADRGSVQGHRGPLSLVSVALRTGGRPRRWRRVPRTDPSSSVARRRGCRRILAPPQVERHPALVGQGRHPPGLSSPLRVCLRCAEPRRQVVFGGPRWPSASRESVPPIALHRGTARLRDRSVSVAPSSSDRRP